MSTTPSLPVPLPAGWRAARRFDNDDKVVVIHGPGAAVTVDLRRRNFAVGVHRLIHKTRIGKYKDEFGLKCLYQDALHALRLAIMHGAVPAPELIPQPTPRHNAGENAHLAKLTWKKVADIRRRLGEGETQTALAREYGVAGSTICDIAQGRTWRATTPEAE
jgi:hypothetical protein